MNSETRPRGLDPNQAAKDDNSDGWCGPKPRTLDQWIRSILDRSLIGISGPPTDHHLSAR